jgi:hypothetical protein
MRPIAALAPAPRGFSDTVVASPGQGPVQHLLRGDDLTVGPGARGRFAAWPRRTPCGQAATQQGADAVEGGNCRRAADQAGGDGGAPVGVNREARTSPHAEPATGHLTRRSPGGVGGGTGRLGRRPGACPRRGVAQFANLDKDPMERRAVALAAGRDPWTPAGVLSPGEWRNSRISTKTLWNAARWRWR